MKFRVHFTKIRHHHVDIDVPEKWLENSLPPQSILDEVMKDNTSRFRCWPAMEDSPDVYKAVGIVIDPPNFKNLK